MQVRKLILVLPLLVLALSAQPTPATPRLEWEAPRSPPGETGSTAWCYLRRFSMVGVLDPAYLRRFPMTSCSETARVAKGKKLLYYSCRMTLIPETKDWFYSVQSCNNAGCSQDWKLEPRVSCELEGGSGCPCGLYPSAPGCTP